MNAEQRHRASAAALAVAVGCGLAADDVVVLSDSNRLVVRLQPCNVIARVAPPGHGSLMVTLSAQGEVDLVDRLESSGAPVAGLVAGIDHRALTRDGFAISLWVSVAARPEPPADYADALRRLHAALRDVEVDLPHVTDRILVTRGWVADPDATPALGDDDRVFLAHTLDRLARSIRERTAAEQPLHGEPHPWNVLDTGDGPRFIDFENGARGPVEYDLAWVPDAVVNGYPGIDRALLDDCRGVVLALIAAHRWHRDDLHPSGRTSGHAFLDAVRAGPPWPTLDVV